MIGVLNDCTTESHCTKEFDIFTLEDLNYSLRSISVCTWVDNKANSRISRLMTKLFLLPHSMMIRRIQTKLAPCGLAPHLGMPYVQWGIPVEEEVSRCVQINNHSNMCNQTFFARQRARCVGTVVASGRSSRGDGRPWQNERPKRERIQNTWSERYT